MTTKELLATLERHGVKIDDWHGGAGSFRDLYIGTGAPWETLARLRDELNAVMPRCATITTVNNTEHPDHGKIMLEVSSFWWE